MAISNMRKRKIAKELQEWIMLGIRAGMRSGAQIYLKNKDINLDNAVLQIKRAIDLPRRARARIDYAILTYTQSRIVDCINYLGDMTAAEMNAELTSLQNYAMALYNRRVNNSESWDSLANDILTNMTNEQNEWTFPLPEDYKDIWGE
jgi:hypothetical protein